MRCLHHQKDEVLKAVIPLGIKEMLGMRRLLLDDRIEIVQHYIGVNSCAYFSLKEKKNVLTGSSSLIYKICDKVS